MVVYTDRGGWGLWWRGGLEVQILVSKSILQGRKDIYNIIIHTAKAGLFYPLGDRREAALGKVLQMRRNKQKLGVKVLAAEAWRPELSPWNHVRRKDRTDCTELHRCDVICMPLKHLMHTYISHTCF